MKVFIAGSQGQLGCALLKTAPVGAVLAGYDIDTLDITNEAAVMQAVAHCAPDIIINAAAYTAVDKAESEESLALAINGKAVGNLARAAHAENAQLVHVSTDFVFDGSASTPYGVDAAPSPINAYGRTKLVGEQLAGSDALIVRTAWVHAAKGSNFVHTMLRLMQQRDEIGVVADQIGTPTWANSLAQAIWSLTDAKVSGIHHFTDSGIASWYDFAMAIMEEALAIGLLEHEIVVNPIRNQDFPTPAARPAYSVLDKSKTNALLGRAAPHWRKNLRQMLKEVKANG